MAIIEAARLKQECSSCVMKEANKYSINENSSKIIPRESKTELDIL